MLIKTFAAILLTVSSAYAGLIQHNFQAGSPASPYSLTNFSGSQALAANQVLYLVNNSASTQNAIYFEPLGNANNVKIETGFSFSSSGFVSGDIVFALVNTNTFGTSGPHSVATPLERQDDTVAVRMNLVSNTVELYFKGGLATVVSPPFALNNGLGHRIWTDITPMASATVIRMQLSSGAGNFNEVVFNGAFEPLGNFPVRPVFVGSSTSVGTRVIDAIRINAVPEPGLLVYLFSAFALYPGRNRE